MSTRSRSKRKRVSPKVKGTLGVGELVLAIAEVAHLDPPCAHLANLDAMVLANSVKSSR